MYRQAPKMQYDDPTKRTTEPVVVGASVIAVTYKDGVLIMADTAASYGSMARFTDLNRIVRINPHTLVGYSGELSDFQYIQNVLEQLTIEDSIEMDNFERYPEEIHSFLCRVMHNYRNKADPLYNQLVTAGFTREEKPFLGYVDLYGTSYVDDIVVTGFGMHMALPLLRLNWRPNMTKDEAIKIVEDAMRVLVYRHCRTINKFQIATYEKGQQPIISAPYELSTQWEYKRFVNPRHQDVSALNNPSANTTNSIIPQAVAPESSSDM